MSEIKFSEDFWWGTGTSAHQVEGDQANDWSRWEPSVADNLANTAQTRLQQVVPDWDLIRAEAESPGNYISGAAVDHYNRFEEDLDTVKALGLKAYRFSVEWSRVEPEQDRFDDNAIAHYRSMAQACRQRGIEPFVTLHHFTNPLWLEDQGGWHGSQVSADFASFTQAITAGLGKDVNHWLTINEPGSYLLMRYLGGGGGWSDWPGMENNPAKGWSYIKNVSRAHKLAYDLIKSVNPRAQVGLSSTAVYWQAGRRDPLSLAAIPLLRYFPERYILNKNKHSVDFIGMNYYLRTIMKAGFKDPKRWADFTSAGPHNDMGWSIYPEGIYHATQLLKNYKKPIYITENGIPDAEDSQREQFIKDHLRWLHKSIQDGADIRGYFYWSLLDNFEWTEGFWPKFGLLAVDRRTMQRTIRPSARVYGRIAMENGFNIDA